MKLRIPDTKLYDTAKDILANLEAGAEEQENEKWHSYKIEVITPIFGGGVEKGTPDPKMPVRASAIRGQLRYWWRFLQRNRTDGHAISGKNLFKAERNIWGGMAEEGEDYSSKVKLRVENIISHLTPQPYSEGGAPYALFPARKQQGEREGKKLIWPKVTFDLKVLVLKDKIPKEDDQTSIKRALRWWATFGGIGGRTRRGCGSVYCAELFNDEETKQDIEDISCQLVCFDSQKYTPTDAVTAWKDAVNTLYKFRQGPTIGRNGTFRKHGRSKWPEPDSIRQIMGTYSEEKNSTHYRKCKTHKPQRNASQIAFPRAAFGLPIIFKFKDEKCGDPQQTELSPLGGERLASPLILTPYPKFQNGTVQYVPAALLIGNRQHIEDMKLYLVLSKDKKKKRWLHPEGKKQEEQWRRNEWDQWTSDWQNKAKMQDVDPIRNNGNTDALTAFMNFFARGGE
jgi:CRISPR-associated protein Cmr1